MRPGYAASRGSGGGSILPLPAPGAPGALGWWPHHSALCLSSRGLSLVRLGIHTSSSPYNTSPWVWGPSYSKRCISAS